MGNNPGPLGTDMYLWKIWIRIKIIRRTIPSISKLQMESLRKNTAKQNMSIAIYAVQLSLHENVVFSVCVRMCNAAYVIFIMWNSISGLDACYHFGLNISCEVAVTVRSPQKRRWLQKTYLKFFWWLLTVTATPQLMLNRKWYQVSTPEMEFHIINITYAALLLHAQTERTTF